MMLSSDLLKRYRHDPVSRTVIKGRIVTVKRTKALPRKPMPLQKKVKRKKKMKEGKNLFNIKLLMRPTGFETTQIDAMVELRFSQPFALRSGIWKQDLTGNRRCGFDSPPARNDCLWIAGS